MAIRIHSNLKAPTTVTAVSARPPNGGAAREGPAAERSAGDQDQRFESALDRLRPPRVPSVGAGQQARSMAQVLDLAVGESRAILEGVHVAASPGAAVDSQTPFGNLARTLAELVSRADRRSDGTVIVTDELRHSAQKLLAAGVPEGESFAGEARKLAEWVTGTSRAGEEVVELAQGLRSPWVVELERLDGQLCRLGPRRGMEVVPSAATASADTLEGALRLVDAAALPEAWQGRLQQSAAVAKRAGAMIERREGVAVSTQANLAAVEVLHLLR